MDERFGISQGLGYLPDQCLNTKHSLHSQMIVVRCLSRVQQMGEVSTNAMPLLRIKFKLSFPFHTLVLSASVSIYANNETKNQLSKSCHTKKDIININPPKNNQLLPFSIPLQNKISPTSTNNNFISYFPSFFKGHYNIYW